MILPVLNGSAIRTNFVLVGLVEISELKYLFSVLAIALYAVTVFVSSLIVFVTWTEESLHEPMNIFMCNLILNVMFGGSAYFPKLAIDLLSGTLTISLPGCLFQAFCIQTYAFVEIFTFTTMAYDRYLAVGEPLRYKSLMTNLTSQKFLLTIWVLVITGITLVTLLTARLTFCGIYINNVYCETMSLLPLACEDVTINNIYGSVLTLITMTGSIVVVIYCYIGTVLVCLRLSGEASKKAYYTLVTHIVAFSIFMVSALFITFRYRLNNGSLSPIAHVAIPMIGMSMSVVVNPLIYGIRTKAVRKKVVLSLVKICQAKDT